MMKQYHLYVFTQDACPPCARLKNYVKTLAESERAELDFVPLKTPSGRAYGACRGACGGAYTDTRCHVTKLSPVKSTDDDEEYCDLGGRIC